MSGVDSQSPNRPEDEKNYQNIGFSNTWQIPPNARLKPIKDDKRRLYATMLAYEHNGRNIELVIGARSRKLVKEVFERLAPGFKAKPELIYDVFWSKANDE